MTELCIAKAAGEVAPAGWIDPKPDRMHHVRRTSDIQNVTHGISPRYLYNMHWRFLTRDFEIFRSEEHTSELQSLMRISYAVFCLKKKKKHNSTHIVHTINNQLNIDN